MTNEKKPVGSEAEKSEDETEATEDKQEEQPETE